MRTRLISSTFLCLLIATNSAVGAVPAYGRDTVSSPGAHAAALWLTRQLHRPVESAQVLAFPHPASLEGCSIKRLRPAPTGATALSLRCPGRPLPQLLLLDLSGVSTANAACKAGKQSVPANCANIRNTTRKQAALPPLVRPGASLHADWRTPSLHAELPVVALDSGAIGSEIRVRVVNSDRVFRAHILTAKSVTIVEAGA